MKVLEYSDNLKQIVCKLPYHMHDQWRNMAYQIKENGDKVTFSHLVKFVRREAKKATDPTFGREAMFKALSDKSTSKVKPRSCASTTAIPVDTPSKHVIKPSISGGPMTRNAFSSPCTYCQGNHTLEHCHLLIQKPFYERSDVLKYKGYCYGCLRFGHQRKDCKHKATCTHCSGRHPSVLHVDGKIPSRSEAVSTGMLDNTRVKTSAYVEVPQKMGNHVGAGDLEVTMAVVPVKVCLRDSCRMIDTYAFMDPGSNVSFCSTSLMHQLGCEGKRLKLKMDTMGVHHTMYTHELKNIEICNLKQQHKFSLPLLYSKDRIPISKHHIPTQEDIANWSHLEGVDLPQIDAEIGLLLGNNVPDAYSPMGCKVGPAGSPHATRTRLGWIVWNVSRPSAQDHDVNHLVNRADVVIEKMNCCRNLEIVYQKSLALDFPEKNSDEKLEHSQDDKRFLQMMTDSKHVSDGHYELCLPFKDHSLKLPDNQFLALQRLKSLRKKLATNEQFHNDYTQFMSALIHNGYAEKVPEGDLGLTGRIWYLPHHGVYHPKNLTKIRVVFDCSAKYRGTSLNDMLLQGPDLTNSLISTLLRFRQEPIAIMGDIEKMFYQVKVAKEDRDCLRFYWWPNGDLQQDPIVYRMMVHLFGAASSPSCATYALHQTADDNKEYFDPVVSEKMKTHFYVDDFLCSLPTEEEAINLVHDISFLCELGGFRLTKWLTNNRNVLESIPVGERSTDMKNIDFDKFPIERVLGVSWDIESDTLGFQIDVQDVSPTRRRLLSVVSSLYDPMGLVSPFVLSAKLLLQDLCHRGMDWDTELSGSDLNTWNQWFKQLPELDKVRIPRCLKPLNFGHVEDVQVHHFCDASERGYGVASYMRYKSTSGRIHCALLFSRSRVAPLKTITIPRMELTAAMVAVCISQKIIRMLDVNAKHVFWTDSMSVIRYIANETTRFYTFVANRISKIRDSTRVDQWRYIESKMNPADIASRGSSAEGLLQTKYWLNGPSFLWLPMTEWPEQPDGMAVIPELDPELKPSVNTGIMMQSSSLIEQLLLHSSNWLKVKRIIAWILKMFDTLRSWCMQRKLYTMQLKGTEPDIANIREIVEQKMKQLKSLPKTRSMENIYLPVTMIIKAEGVIVKDTQHQYYSTELLDLGTLRAGGVKPLSSLYKLDPFVEDGFLRVGGRLQRSYLSYDAKHQMVIPQKSPLSMLILYDIHRRVGHMGRNTMLAKLRKSYWIPKAGVLIKGILSRCVICRRYRAKACVQKMADLPVKRVVPDKPPFTHVGMDYFGPIEAKRGRAVVKRYGVVFTCFTTRAVHLEVSFSLDTNSCINAIRRFMARRGTVESITSDNGTNLVGAERELRESIEQWEKSKIAKTLHHNNVEWNFNPPSASHFGGVWERIIRMVRKVLYGLLHEQVIHLDDEGLQTLLCEVESILNDRPISTMSDDPNDLDALTPNHLLTLRTQQRLPVGVFDKSDNYVRRRWRQVQYLTDIFWKRWRREYLCLLQERHKWLRPRRNIEVGDIVLVIDNPRNAWTMAKFSA